MALRVWLPLNGNLENKGISDITVTNNGATVDDNGKIGKCYYFNGSSYCYENTYNWSNFNTSTFSLCCWYKEPSPVASGNSQIICIGTSSGWNNIRIGLLRRTSNGYPMFSVSNGSSAVQYNFTATNFSLDVWNHIAVTYNNGTMSMYINGVLDKTMNTTIVPVLNSSQHLGIGSASNGAEKLSGYLNDVRIYDHCLSPLEVKEISQGLILHYKLDGFSGGAGENLAIGTNTADISTNVFNQSNQTGGITKEIVYEDGIPCVKITRNDVAQSGWKYFSYNNFLRNNIKTSTQYTVSFDIKASVNGTIGFTGLVQGNATNYMTKSTSVEQGTVTQNVWSHIILHCITKDSFSDITIGSQVIYMSPSASLVDIGVSYLLKNMKLEEGENATSWTPSLSETGIDTSKIIDSSGYGRDGIQNNVTIIAESDRYNNSTNFNGTNSYVKVPDNNWMSQGLEALTINLWAKATTWPTNGGRLLSCTETGGFNLEGGSSGYWRFPIHVYTNAEKTSTAYKYDSKEIQISALTPNNWNMITLVYDTTGTKTYINGQLHHTYTNTSYGIHFNTNARLFLGCEANTANPGGNYFNGQESDFRLYATALSAEDILDLYHTPANIDNLGGIHGFEFIEKTPNLLNPDPREWTKESSVTCVWNEETGYFDVNTNRDTSVTSRWGVYTGVPIKPNTAYLFSAEVLDNKSYIGVAGGTSSRSLPSNIISWNGEKRYYYFFTTSSSHTHAWVYLCSKPSETTAGHFKNIYLGEVGEIASVKQNGVFENEDMIEYNENGRITKSGELAGSNFIEK